MAGTKVVEAVALACLLALGAPLAVGAGSAESNPLSLGIAELTEKATRGDTLSQVQLVMRYSVGKGVPPDKKEAVKWFLMAHAGLRNLDAQGVKSAQTLLGSLVELAKSRELDIPHLKPITWEEKREENKTTYHNEYSDDIHKSDYCWVMVSDPTPASGDLGKSFSREFIKYFGDGSKCDAIPSVPKALPGKTSTGLRFLMGTTYSEDLDVNSDELGKTHFHHFYVIDVGKGHVVMVTSMTDPEMLDRYAAEVRLLVDKVGGRNGKAQ